MEEVMCATRIRRIAILYQTTEGPWGGGNSFLRSLKRAWLGQGIQVLGRLQLHLDGVLVSSSYLGPGRLLLPHAAQRLVRHGYMNPVPAWLGLSRWRGARPPFVHRLDGVFRLYGRRTDDLADAAQFQINRCMDWTIFQTEYCRRSFAAEGLEVSRSTVIFNGVDLDRFVPAEQPPAMDITRLIAVAWSPNLWKGFPAMVKASRIPGVEVTFVGNWPQDFDPEAVKVIPPQTHDELPALLRQHHALLHMAQNDPCSNAILEAMACGLPVIYHPSGGSPEIVASCGVPGEPHLAVAVEELRDRYHELRQCVLERRSTFSIDCVARAYLQVFEQLGPSDLL
jgi:glycosyltransferase involved in cell wall biosynthesis